MALRGTPRPSAIPASQNTAPVNEYRCLFTSDLRRKQKRWQDGYLKYHTFNSRVMVYDTSRNFLGDTYWKESNEVQEGDELTLDKGIMVEVAEAMGVTQTDLTPILDRKKESPLRNNSAPMQRAVPRPAIPATNALRAGSQLRHKSLNTLLGTPKGPTGKAAPMRSPFETRKEKENQGEEERASKRQKTACSPVEQTTSSPVAVNKPTSNKSLPLWAKTSDAKTDFAPPRPLPRPAAVITLDSEPDNISSDVTLPSTPPGIVRPLSRPNTSSMPGTNQRATEEAPAFTTPRIPKGRVPVPHVKAQATPRPPPEPSSPPISASNRLSNVDFALQPVRKPTINTDVADQNPRNRPDFHLTAVQPLEEPFREPSLPRSPSRSLKSKPLRLSKGVKRGMLLCQYGLPRNPVSAEPKQVPKPKGKRQTELPRDDIIHVISDDEDTEHRKQPKSGKAASGTQKKKRGIQPAAIVIEPKPLSPSPGPSLDSFDDMELIHGFMDQQLMVTPSPPRPSEPTKTASPMKIAADPKPAAKKVPKKGKRAAEASPDESTKLKKTKTVTSKEGGAKPRAKRKQAEEPEPVQHDSPPMSPVLDSTKHQSRNTSTEPTIPVEKRLGTTSASVSPSKLMALSRGGFRKKVKSVQSKPTATETDAPVPHPITGALPPHPLRANRSGPLMSTTELSALLTKSTKPIRLEDDPIEDSTQNTSPSKSLQRSRSENDAPIPSMSEAWEERNLLKAPVRNSSVTSAAKPDEALPKPKAGGLAALVKRTDPRRKFQRTQSLNVETNVLGIAQTEVVIPPIDHDVGPWSTEAFDLFGWRPPNAEGEEQSNGAFVDGR